MIFDNLNEKYLEDAVTLAQEEYNLECKHVKSLYKMDYTDIITNNLQVLFKRNMGFAAIENGKLQGFISFCGRNPEQFGRVAGSFSPLYANAYGKTNRARMASQLFQHASEQLIKQNILSYALCVYGHNSDVIHSLSMSGFGIRCSDGIRSLDKPFSIDINPDYHYEEIHYSDANCLLSLKNSLGTHMSSSPTYLPTPNLSKDAFATLCSRRKSRFFVAKDSSEIIGYIEIKDSGESFISTASDYKHIVGAFLKEKYRGKGIQQSLLSLAFDKLKTDGVKRIGVDCETLNPNAYNFWRKYFDSYTFSLVRRLDERILK